MRPLSVGEIMTRKVVTMNPEDDLAKLHDRMAECNIRHVPVVDEHGTLVGLVSHRDLLRSTLVERPGVSRYVEDSILEGMKVGEVMTTELEVTSPETDLREAARIMLREKYGCLPVVDGDRLVGILTASDFLRVVLYED